MGKSSRDKGKRGERELAAALNAHGYDCRRGVQYSGANGDADVVGLEGIHLECKRTERLNLYDAMAQAAADALPGEMPVVMHRRNHSEWLAVMKLDDWIKLYREMSTEGWAPGCRWLSGFGFTGVGHQHRAHQDFDFWFQHYPHGQRGGETPPPGLPAGGPQPVTGRVAFNTPPRESREGDKAAATEAVQ